MHGNVDEWCSDWYGESYYTQAPRQDPQGPQTGDHHVQRGGSWAHSGWACRAASRHGNYGPNIRNPTLGFRVVLVAGAWTS
jgi:formylglycine-generating enzyme required for sulfatase activity